MTSQYRCTDALSSAIPTPADTQTGRQEIFAWNETTKTSPKSRPLSDGTREDAPKFGLSAQHILTIERLSAEPAAMLGATGIADQIDAAR